MRVMRGLVVLFCLCLSFIGAAALRAGDSSDKWFTLLHQTAELYGECCQRSRKDTSVRAGDDCDFGNGEHRLATLRELGMVYEREVKFAEAKTLSREALELQERCTGRATRTWRLRSSEKLFATTHLAR
jgi:hypothetical protein